MSEQPPIQRPGAPRAARPRPVRAPAPESEASVRLRKRLLTWMAVVSVALLGVIGFRLYQKLTRGERSVVNVREEGDAAYDRARSASRDVQRVQSKAVPAVEPLPAAELEPLKAQRTVLEESQARIKELLDLLHQHKLDDSPERDDLSTKLLQVKLWILDLDDFLDSSKAAPAYGGFTVPMERARARAQVVHKELKEVEGSKAGLVDGGDAAAKAAAVVRLKELEGKLAGLAEEFGRLEDYVKTGLARPDLSPKQIPELEGLREETSRAMMGRQQARSLRARLAE